MALDEDRGYDNSNLEQVLSRAREMIGKKFTQTAAVSVGATIGIRLIHIPALDFEFRFSLRNYFQ